MFFTPRQCNHHSHIFSVGRWAHLNGPSIDESLTNVTALSLNPVPLGRLGKLLADGFWNPRNESACARGTPPVAYDVDCLRPKLGPRERVLKDDTKSGLPGVRSNCIPSSKELGERGLTPVGWDDVRICRPTKERLRGDLRDVESGEMGEPRDPTDAKLEAEEAEDASV